MSPRCLVATRALLASILFVCSSIACSAEGIDDTEQSKGLLKDIRLYFTSPLRWDSKDWLLVGGAVATVGIAHHYDEDARAHFVRNGISSTASSHELDDALPAAAALAGTWLAATLWRDSSGYREFWAMTESAALSGVTAYALKFAAGRQRPSETADPNSWRHGGDSFPSLHTTTAFAIGTVLAESGNEDYRWVRRTLGYGIGIVTAYQRVKHNRHWLSDTVAGAALGASTAYFVIDRHSTHAAGHPTSEFAFVPIDGGVELSYSLALK